ncbi:hypothetical protein M3Y98_00001800 [Aphelenchoides besseyi]|nr:hypothetical protein M3Y98_00001800 [Aphelenchoides besseyi]KAI6198442.1 hypothetical protein M3Y96_00519700 [Aphelenchoides besseyi]
MDANIEAVLWLVVNYYWGPRKDLDKKAEEGIAVRFFDLYKLSVCYSFHRLHEKFMASAKANLTMENVVDRVMPAMMNNDTEMVQFLMDFVGGEDKLRELLMAKRRELSLASLPNARN